MERNNESRGERWRNDSSSCWVERNKPKSTGKLCVCVYVCMYLYHTYTHIYISVYLRTAYSFHKHCISQKRKMSEVKLNEFVGYIWAIYHCFPILFLDQDLPTKSKHIFYGRDSKVVLYSLHHLGSVHSSPVLGLLAAAHITAFSLAGKPMFVLDGTQDRELCV